MRQLLASGVLGGLGQMTKFARCAAVEGDFECLRRWHRFGIVVKHFHPTDDLDDVPQRAIGTEPGEEQTTDGEITPHDLYGFISW